jgi:hypothetical protein
MRATSALIKKEPKVNNGRWAKIGRTSGHPVDAQVNVFFEGSTTVASKIHKKWKHSFLTAQLHYNGRKCVFGSRYIFMS